VNRKNFDGDVINKDSIDIKSIELIITKIEEHRC